MRSNGELGGPPFPTKPHALKQFHGVTDRVYIPVVRKFPTEALGQIGETELQRIALREQLVANPVKRDVRGYDFVVEFTDEASVPAADLAASSRRVFIQVKASQTKRPSAPIKLSNWQKMVLDPNPWFVLFVQVDGKGDVEATFLSHIDEALQTRTLKALRSCSEPPHKKTLKLSAKKSDRLRDGQLRSAFEKAVGDWDSYPTRKKSFTSSVGYENGHRLFQVSFERKPNNAHIREWVDATLGLPVKIRAKRVVEIDNRFSVPVQIREFGPVTLEMTPPGELGSVRITPEQGDPRQAVSLRTTIFTTNLNPNIPETYSCARFSCGPLDFILDLNPPGGAEDRVGLKLTIRWDYEHRSRFDDLVRAAKALLLMHRVSTTFSFSRKGKPGSPTGHLSTVPLPSDKVFELKIVASLSGLAQVMDLSDVEISPGEILDNVQQWALAGRLLSGEASDVSLDVNLIGGAVAPCEIQAAIIMCPAVDIDKVRVTFVGAFLGDFELRDGRLQVTASSVRLHRVREKKVERAQLVIDVSELSSLLETENYFVVRPNEFLPTAP